MLSTVLNSERAIHVNIAIMRAFVRLKQASLTHAKILRKLKLLMKRMYGHDETIEQIFRVIEKLLMPHEQRKRRIGFHHG